MIVCHQKCYRYVLKNYQAFINNRLPEDMKTTQISLIFKKKDDMIKDNCRPISILAIFSKVFETIIAKQLM